MSPLLLLPLLLGCATEHHPACCADDSHSHTDSAGGGGGGEEETDPLPETPAGQLVFRGAVLLGAGEVADLSVAEGRFAAVASDEATIVDASGRWIVPAFIDSHVHFAYRPRTDEVLAGGVAAGVDMAAPAECLAKDLAPMRVLWSGPMVTAVGGYPTDSWGRDGYGIECADAQAAEDAAVTLAEAGAGLIKLPLSGSAVLDEGALRAAADAARARDLLVSAHALSDAEAALAARIGADVLAHTPTRALDEATVAAWSDRAVVSTLAAFGGSGDAVANLRALRAAGATVLYGTDYGNLSDDGISGREIDLLVEAGLSGEDILSAATAVPAAFWGFDGLGTLDPGAEASFLILTADPREEPAALASPEQVWIQGTRRK